MTEATFLFQVTLSGLVWLCTPPAPLVSLYPFCQLILGQPGYCSALAGVMFLIVAERTVWLALAPFGELPLPGISGSSIA